MRLITNEKLIKRNARLGRATNITGLLILFGGVFISITRPELVGISFGALLLGFIFTNVGIYFSNRWLRPPRPDQALDAALKGLDDRYSLYHYRLGAAHALFSPTGVFVLVTRFQRGEVTFDPQRGRWRHKGGSTYLKLFGQESMGNPSAEAAVEADALARKLKKLLPDQEVPPITPVIVFTSEHAQVSAEGSPVPAVHAKKLKEYIRAAPKGRSLPNETLRVLEDKLALH